jgi:protein-S-isoprenylcysteine O-methyltransferase Ste14
MASLNARAVRASVIGALLMGALLFLSAGTLEYWQAWVFIAVFTGASSAVTVYLAVNDPALLERRLKGGPTAETETTQKLAVSLALVAFASLLMVPALDHRFGWSTVPSYVSLVGNALIVVSFVFIFFVLRENPYGASTIRVERDQRVISTGPYALVRHPMYAGALVLVIGIPLALGSWWGLLAIIVMIPALVWRLTAEEQFLSKHLPGYADYAKRIHYRLVPLVF